MEKSLPTAVSIPFNARRSPQSEFKKQSLPLDIFFKQNLFNINLNEVNVNLEGIFINNKLALLGIKKTSLTNQWKEGDEEFFKIGSSIIFYNLTR